MPAEESNAHVGAFLEVSTSFLMLYLGNLEITGGKIICECHETRTTFCVINFALESTNMRSPVTVEERVAVTVWSTVHWHHFLVCMGRSTVGKIVLETCSIMTTKLLSRYMHFPEGTRLREVVGGFEAYWGFPQVAGVIDGTHIPIISPQIHQITTTRKFHSIIMQAVVDFHGLFLDTYIGWPGEVHDARVFSNLAVYRKGRPCYLLGKGESMELRYAIYLCFEIPLLILGDPAYPLLPWLMKPYSVIPNITSTQTV